MEIENIVYQNSNRIYSQNDLTYSPAVTPDSNMAAPKWSFVKYSHMWRFHRIFHQYTNCSSISIFQWKRHMREYFALRIFTLVVPHWIGARSYSWRICQIHVLLLFIPILLTENIIYSVRKMSIWFCLFCAVHSKVHSFTDKTLILILPFFFFIHKQKLFAFDIDWVFPKQIFIFKCSANWMYLTMEWSMMHLHIIFKWIQIRRIWWFYTTFTFRRTREVGGWNRKWRRRKLSYYLQ